MATFGLLSIIWGCSRLRSTATPYAVASYIVAAYWFTASTSFANPAVALARAHTRTLLPEFAHRRSAIRPRPDRRRLSATILFRWLAPAQHDADDPVADSYQSKPAFVDSQG